MARETEKLVSLPLLDRLTDHEKSLASDPPVTRAQSVRLLKAALRRDLEWLFNTRSNEELPQNMKELQASVLNYGMPDYTHMSMGNHGDRFRVQRQMERAIALFEPRLSGVTVRLSGAEGGYEPGRAVRFQIDGMLNMDPAPEHISFDTVLDIPSGEYQVKGDSSAG